MRQTTKLTICMLILCANPLDAADATFRDPRPVAIDNLPQGDGGTPISTEEPFVSRDGRFLFFNSGEKENHKDLHYAEWQGDCWNYRGAIGPAVNTADKVEGNPTMDAAYNLFYVDSASKTMAREAHFDPNTGTVGALRDVTGIPERVVKPFKSLQGNMGVEISADGQTLYFSRATWKMRAFWLGSLVDSDILFARKRNGRYIYDDAQVKVVMKNVNTTDLEYAASISADGLELFFTRLAVAGLKRGEVHSQIMRATRANFTEPFSVPLPIAAIGSDDFVEGPSIGPDGTELYYHKREGLKFRLYKVRRPR